MSKKTSGGNHRSSHTITDEEDDVLSLLLGERQDSPNGGGGGTVVVSERDIISTRVVKLDVSVGFSKDVDGCGSLGVGSEKVGKVGEVVLFDYTG